MAVKTRPSEAVAAILALSPAIRYAAVSRAGEVAMSQREGLVDASTAETDRYEELLVNPTLLSLARARGEIDCGGIRFLVVGYGNFQQLILPLEEGHASVCFPHGNDPRPHLDAIRAICGETGPPAGGSRDQPSDHSCGATQS